MDDPYLQVPTPPSFSLDFTKRAKDRLDTDLASVDLGSGNPTDPGDGDRGKD